MIWIMHTAQIIALAGGAQAIYRASLVSRRPLHWTTPTKWTRIGIPEEHWQLVMQLAGPDVTPDRLHEANEKARAKRRAARA